MTDSATRSDQTNADPDAADAPVTDPAADPAESTGHLSTQPAPPSKPVRRTLLGVARYWWRQLTSMRTALVLLFLLALAAVPGSLLPQRSLNQGKVAEYFQQHPDLAPILDKLGFFEVFSSPWFAAIYLLLFISLVGCLTPRIRLHAKALRTPPPPAPRRFDRLPESATAYADPAGGDPGQTGEPGQSEQPGQSGESRGPDAAELAERAETELRRRRWRVLVRRDGETVAVCAEKGYLRETGNLIFHLSMVALLVALAVGRLWGYEGSVIVEEGRGFCNSVQSYDTFRAGPLVSGSDLTPLCVDVDKYTTSFEPDLTPSEFRADVTYTPDLGAPSRKYAIEVNSPLRLDGVRTYLTGHGYSPVFTVTLPGGRSYTDVSAPFLPTDQTTFGSQGALKLPDTGDPTKQLALEGFFAPTAADSGDGVITSVDPRLNDPVVALVAYQGLLGLDSGRAQSVYAIDQRQLQLDVLKQVGEANLGVGQSLTIDDGTVVTFTGVKEYAVLQVSRDPGQTIVLAAAVLMMLGLVGSLRVRRRRVWVRVRPEPAGAGGRAGGAAGLRGDPGPDEAAGRRTVVEVGGLARSDPAAFRQEFESLQTAVLSGLTEPSATADTAGSTRRSPESANRPGDPGETSPEPEQDTHGKG